RNRTASCNPQNDSYAVTVPLIYQIIIDKPWPILTSRHPEVLGCRSCTSIRQVTAQLKYRTLALEYDQSLFLDLLNIESFVAHTIARLPFDKFKYHPYRSGIDPHQFLRGLLRWTFQVSPSKCHTPHCGAWRNGNILKGRLQRSSRAVQATYLPPIELKASIHKLTYHLCLIADQQTYTVALHRTRSIVQPLTQFTRHPKQVISRAFRVFIY
ncbi:hypothetical protein BDP27DRAFT_1261379, partial [Rhodocollybia butyracea]